MPYDNVPPEKQAAMEACVTDLKDKGNDEVTAIKICYASVVEGKSIDTTSFKIGAAISQANMAKIQSAHDTMTMMGAKCDPANCDQAAPDETMPEDQTAKSANALKTISTTDDEVRIGNYMILFGGRDLTGIVRGKNKDGSKGEFFSPRTEPESSYTKTGMLHVDFEHGLDPDGLGITSDDVLGFVDWKTARKDERGIFVERVLNRRNKYVEWVKELVDAGLVGNSTEAVEGQVQKTAQGEITKWPLKRDTLTVMPMEPRMLQTNVFAAIKGLSEKYPALKSLIIGDPPQEPSGALVEAVTKSVVSESPLPKEGKPMPELTEDQLKAFAVSAVEEYKRTEPAMASAGAVSVVVDAADQPFKSAGEYFMSVKNAELDRSSEDKRLRPLKAAAGLNEGNPADGGYLIPPQFAAGIQQNMFSVGDILSRVDMLNVTGNDMTWNQVDETSRASTRFGGVLGYWLAEAGTKLPSAPKFRQFTLKLKKVAAVAYSTDELLTDASALQGWLTTNVPDELRFQVENAFINSLGVGQPTGIINAPGTLSITRVDGSKVQLADLLAMYERRLGNGAYVWLVNRTVIAQLMQLAGTYQYLWMPPGGLEGSPNSRLLGYPVVETEYCPALGTVGDIILADLKQYQAISKGGVETASSIHVKFLTDETAFRFVYRVDGAPKLASAITPFKGTSLSPFITLSTSS